MHLPCTESEPRDAGTDQKSSGIIRLHTIKQIIDRVRESTPPHIFKCSGKRWRYKHLLTDLSRWCKDGRMRLWNTAHRCPLVVYAIKMVRLWDDRLIKLMQTDKPTEVLSAHMVVFYFWLTVNMLVMRFLCVFSTCLCRTSTQCWISRQMQWIGWTTLSGIQLWCSWTQTPSRVSRTWGPVSAQNLGRVPGSYMKDLSNYEKITNICLPVSHRAGGIYKNENWSRIFLCAPWRMHDYL